MWTSLVKPRIEETRDGLLIVKTIPDDFKDDGSCGILYTNMRIHQ